MKLGINTKVFTCCDLWFLMVARIDDDAMGADETNIAHSDVFCRHFIKVIQFLEVLYNAMIRS